MDPDMARPAAQKEQWFLGVPQPKRQAAWSPSFLDPSLPPKILFLFLKMLQFSLWGLSPNL